MYGISFPDAKQLKEWQKFQEEAAKRDHRKLGKVRFFLSKKNLFDRRRLGV